MKCENELCIYENCGTCMLNRIELDIHGLCKECILIDLDKNDLEKMKIAKRIKLNDD